MQQLHEIVLKIGFTTISECFHEVDRGGLSLVKFETFLVDKPPMKKMFGTLSKHTLTKHRPCKHEATTKFPKTNITLRKVTFFRFLMVKTSSFKIS